MKLTTAGEVAHLAPKLGYSEIRIQRVTKTDTGWAVFGIHPDGHRGRITQSDLEKTATERSRQ